MSSLRNFKDTADEIMKDITVSSELKEKTLMKCTEKNNRRFIRSLMLPAVCAGIILILGVVWGHDFKIQIPNYLTGSNEPQNANVMIAPENSTSPLSSNSEQGTLSSTIKSVDLKTMGDAKEFLEVEILEPSYLPGSFKIKRIYGIMDESNRRKSGFIECVSGDKTFVISVEQNTDWKSFEGYKNVDINGVQGYMNTFEESSIEISELRWFMGKNLYIVSGAISEADALKVARSLK